jgi:hypothetical protein
MNHKDRMNLYRVGDGDEKFAAAFKKWLWASYTPEQIINNGYPDAMETRDAAFKAAYYSVSNCGRRSPPKDDVLAKYRGMIEMEKRYDEMIAESERLAREAGALRCEIYNSIDADDEPEDFKWSSVYMSH